MSLPRGRLRRHREHRIRMRLTRCTTTDEGVDATNGASARQNTAGAIEQGQVTHANTQMSGSRESGTGATAGSHKTTHGLHHDGRRRRRDKWGQRVSEHGRRAREQGQVTHAYKQMSASARAASPPVRAPRHNVPHPLHHTDEGVDAATGASTRQNTASAQESMGKSSMQASS